MFKWSNTLQLRTTTNSAPGEIASARRKVPGLLSDSKKGVPTVNKSTLRNVAPATELVDLDDNQIRNLVSDLHRVNAPFYWCDLLLTAALGWTAFGAAVMLRPFSWGMLAAAAVAALSLYRALCFLHEISHQSQRTLPRFETIWNFVIGYPLLMPSFAYVGVHGDHHKISTYGTSADPEYLPFARSSGMTTAFALESILIPAILLIRFLILAPIGFVWPRFENWLIVHASSLTMNVHYRRTVTPALLNRVRLHSVGILLIWAPVMALLIAGIFPWRLLAVWFGVSATASFINTMRTLGAHAYESSGEPLDRKGQLHDSIDTPGRFWTELWAPVGLRYHALHHYFPGIPYHNLSQAYQRLISAPPLSTAYRNMSSPSLPHSLRSLYVKGLRAWK
jgi:fatty acid desaturase